MAALISLLLSCGGDAVEKAVTPRVEELSPVQVLSRASLDLRGVRPNVQEIEAVEKDPAALDAMLDGFVDDPRFGARVRALFSSVYLTRQDAWDVTAADFGLVDEPAFAASVGEEPLRVLSTIAEQDLPYYELVTGDWTMANEVLGEAFPVDYPEGETGWKQVHYTDGRPAAGVLATNGFWWHYGSNLTNSNRGRANAVSKVLLCNDYLSRPIEFSRDVNLLDRDALNDALSNNPGCAACHVTLDPMASYFWGFYYLNTTSRVDASVYHAERERLWQIYTNVAPGYYGEPGTTLTDLGWQIAADSRFPECVTQQVMEAMLQRDVMLEDTEYLTQHREALLASDMRLKPLFKSMIRDIAYRAASSESPRYVPHKMMGPELLASQIEDLTGFRFVYEGYDMMTTDSYGLRVLAGGVDGVYATRPAEFPTTTMLLVQERLAQGAASYVVDRDATAASPRLFTEVKFTETPTTGRDAMVRQIQALHLRMFGKRVAPDSQEVTDNLSLWEGLYAVDGDAKLAWAGLASVLMRDPDFILY